MTAGDIWEADDGGSSHASPPHPRPKCCCLYLLTPLGGGRKWEYLKANKNGKVPAQKMHVKKGDFVQVRCTLSAIFQAMLGCRPFPEHVWHIHAPR